jgi:hypothetical protein
MREERGRHKALLELEASTVIEAKGAIIESHSCLEVTINATPKMKSSRGENVLARKRSIGVPPRRPADGDNETRGSTQAVTHNDTREGKVMVKEKSLDTVHGAR